jgi:hypothetical protein
MKYLSYLILSFFIITGCNETGYNSAIDRIKTELLNGNVTIAEHLADSLKGTIKDSILIFKADSLSEIAERIRLEYSVDETNFREVLEKSTGSVNDIQLNDWQKKGWLESRFIDGRRMYYNRAASNLLRVLKFHEQRNGIANEEPVDSELVFRLKHTLEVLSSAKGESNPVLPVKMSVAYTISVDADAVPAGEIVRCWLPFPRSDSPRQNNIKLLETSEPEYIIAPDTAVHSSIYMESPAIKGKPVIFRIVFTYESSAQHFDLKRIKNIPYEKSSAVYKEFTSEELPHINFSEHVKSIADDSIAYLVNNPVGVVSGLYGWFKDNVPWAGAPEYSIIPDISDYVIKNRRGDCGMQTLLLMSLLRYKGVPVRWQSGWMVPPGHENLHDWCEVYYEGTGWVPVDVSYVLQRSDIQDLRYFYISGIDSYRLVINNGIAGPLHPGKKFLRSEPYDFQRGEVEWKGGNLFFDKRNYNIEIKYLN